MIFTTDTMQGVPLIAKVPRYVKKYVEFFADLTLQGALPYPATGVAVALVCCLIRRSPVALLLNPHSQSTLSSSTNLQNWLRPSWPHHAVPSASGLCGALL